MSDGQQQFVAGLAEQTRQINDLWFRHIFSPSAAQSSSSSSSHSIESSSFPLPAGLLLRGPDGIGKRLLVTQLAQMHGIPVSVVEGRELVQGGYIGEGANKLRDAFRAVQTSAEQAAGHRTGLLIITDIDVCCPKRGEGNRESGRVVTQLVALLDGLQSWVAAGKGRLLLAATTTNANAIDLALRRPGRLDREIAFLPPDAAGRLEILELHTQRMPIDDRQRSLPLLADACVGFLGSDLSRLCRDTATLAIAAGAEVIDRAQLERAFATAVRRSPYQRSEVHSFEYPNVSWDRIAGHRHVKEELRAAVVLPQLMPEVFTRFRLPTRTGILLYGPPGTGKTMLARACAAESNVAFLSASSASIYSPYVGGAEEAVRGYFAAARAASPCVLFFDEIEAIVGKRGQEGSDSSDDVQSRVLSTFLNEVDGIEASPGIIFLGATNRIDMIDPALLRPGRFDKRLYVGAPDAHGLRELWKIYASNRMPVHEDVDLEALAQASPALSGAQIENVCREAAILALREDINAAAVHHRHFATALAAHAKTLLG